MNRNIDYDFLLQKMINGKLDQEERYWLEKKALDDPMLFEAIEGFAKVSDPRHQDIISGLQKRIIEQKEERKNILWSLRVPISIAASLAIILFVGNYFMSSNTSDNSLAVVTDNTIGEMAESDNALTDAEIPDDPATPTARTSPVGDDVTEEIVGTMEEVKEDLNPIVRPEQDGMVTNALKPPEMAINETEVQPSIAIDKNTLNPMDKKSDMALVAEQSKVDREIALTKKSKITGNNKMGVINQQEIPASPNLRDLYLQREITARYTQLENFIPVQEDITFILHITQERKLDYITFEKGNKEAAAMMMPIIEQFSEVIISTSDDNEKVKFTYKSK